MILLDVQEPLPHMMAVRRPYKGGDYGWAIDQTTETDWLYNAILAGTTEVRQPAYAYSGLCRDTNDIGNTYVEIDLTNQRMVFYKDGTASGRYTCSNRMY